MTEGFNEETPKEESQTLSANTTSNNYTIRFGNTNTTSGVGWNCSGCGSWVGTHQYHNCPGATYYRWYDYSPTYVYTTATKCCPYCKAINHDTPEACSRVKSIKYHESGKIKSIRFHRDAD